MKKRIFCIFFVFFMILGCFTPVHAIKFNLLILPTDIMSVCDNYFCFPEVSNIIADDVINSMELYPDINTISLSQIRNTISKNQTLAQEIDTVLKTYKNTDKVDFKTLKNVANAFGVKSVLLINTYAINDKTSLRRNLWDILEISSAFKITYPFELKTNAVLTDCANNIIMWSGKYSKNVSDTFGYYSASNQTQAMSQLEKIKNYSRETISKNIGQNVFMRFFPKAVRTFTVKSSQNKDDSEMKFIPNALDHLSDPHLLKEFESDSTNSNFRKFGSDDFIYQF